MKSVIFIEQWTRYNMGGGGGGGGGLYREYNENISQIQKLVQNVNCRQ